ncbi:MAG: ectoine/hydroxyectoine ABC transporter permease subunit EhuD [Planctomycetota bacterium]
MTWDTDFAISILPELMRGLWVTIQAVALGMSIALVLGLGWALARRSPRRFLAWPASAFVEVVRSTPLLVQIYFLYYALPSIGLRLSAFPTGVLALGLHYSTYATEVYRAGIESVPRGQWEASRAVNLTRAETYRHVILPQAIPPVVPALGNYLIAMFKDTPMLSAITVLEILRRSQIIGKESFRFLEPLTIVGIAYLLLSLLSARLVSRLERHLGRIQAPGLEGATS